MCPKIRNISTLNPPRSASTPLSSASWPKRAARVKSTGAPLGVGHWKVFRISAGLCVSMNLLLLANIQTLILVMTCSWLCLGCILCWHMFAYKAVLFVKQIGRTIITNPLDFTTKRWPSIHQAGLTWTSKCMPCFGRQWPRERSFEAVEWWWEGLS